MSAPGRLAAAKAALTRTVAAEPAGERIEIVLAEGSPARALPRRSRAASPARSAPSSRALAPSSLSARADGRGRPRGRPRRHDHRDPGAGRPAPAPDRRRSHASCARSRLGAPATTRASSTRAARCGIGTADGCEIEATLANLGSRPSVDRITAKAAGRQPLRFTINSACPAGRRRSCWAPSRASKSPSAWTARTPSRATTGLGSRFRGRPGRPRRWSSRWSARPAGRWRWRRLSHAVPGHRTATADAVQIPPGGRPLERSRDP